MKNNTPPNKDSGDSIPLKERKGDIIPLVRRFIEEAQKQLKTTPEDISKEAEKYIMSYEWEGGEEELEREVKRACILSDSPVLQADDLDVQQRQVRSIGRFVESRLKGYMKNIKRFDKFNLYNMVIPEVEKSLIMMVLKETRWNQLRTANILGINRNTLRSKMKKLGIRTDRGKS